MIALVQDFFIENAGKKLNNDQLLKFIKDNCIDIEKKGVDLKSGYGLFTLPDPKKINITKYIKNKEEEKEILRYELLRDVPEGEFHEVVKELIEREIIRGYSGEGEDTKVDLSVDMVRMLVINYRAGIYNR